MTSLAEVVGAYRVSLAARPIALPTIEPYAVGHWPGVYFVAADEVGRVKIGHSGDLAKRLCGRPLTESPCAQRIVALVPCSSKAEAFDLEKRLHVRFGYLRAHLEWFRLDDSLRTWIADARQRVDAAWCSAANEPATGTTATATSSPKT